MVARKEQLKVRLKIYTTTQQHHHHRHHFVCAKERSQARKKKAKSRDVSFFGETPNEKKEEASFLFERNASFVERKITHTHNTQKRLIIYYISKQNAQLTTAFLRLFLRDTLRCSRESAFLRRFIRSRYILLCTDSSSSSWKARNFEKKQRCRVTDNY